MTTHIIALSHEMDAHGALSELGMARLTRAATLFHATKNARLVTSGWAYRDDTDLSLADATAREAIRCFDVPSDKILTLPDSKDTVGEAVFLARAESVSSAMVVTSGFHVARASQIFAFVLGPSTFLQVFGTEGPNSPEIEASEAASLDIFSQTFQGITPGNRDQILKRLFEKHPLYNGS